MRRSALDVLACPSCLGRLEVEDSAVGDVDRGRLRCASEGLEYPVLAGIPRLVRPVDAARIEAFAESYGQAWAAHGWGSRDPSYLAALPYRDVTRRHSRDWRVKARSLDALLAALQAQPPLRVLDLGCGVGWLSRSLAAQGHDVLAMDVLLDDALGLGAAGFYAAAGPCFERVWADLQRPPVKTASVDLVVYNASLHYARDLESSLEEAARVLRPAGRLILLNSPVHRDAASARRAETDARARLQRDGAIADVADAYHHFVRGELIATLTRHVGPVWEIAFDPGRWFRFSRRAKGLALRMELASFPILVAGKPSEAR